MNRYNDKRERAARMTDFRKGVKDFVPSSSGNIYRVDKGPVPTVINIDAKAIENENYISALWTGANLQLTVMSVPAHEEIPMEIHGNEDQMVYVVKGEGEVTVGSSVNSPEVVSQLKSGYCVLIPAAKHHMIRNSGERELKLFSVYAPPVHLRGTVKTKR